MDILLLHTAVLMDVPLRRTAGVPTDARAVVAHTRVRCPLMVEEAIPVVQHRLMAAVASADALPR
jgi:hypothetical protein